MAGLDKVLVDVDLEQVVGTLGKLDLEELLVEVHDLLIVDQQVFGRGDEAVDGVESKQVGIEESLLLFIS